jgi:formate C-acetyltransferase
MRRSITINCRENSRWLEAVSLHIERFADLAREMAATETRENRRDELLAMAENCDIIAHEPPKTFWQALQLCYFVQLILQIESNGHSVSFARMDQHEPTFTVRPSTCKLSSASRN